MDCLEKEPARPAADVLLSYEGHELRIGPRVRARG
jgi:hypothetical protein